jgi:hypothetical protein
MHNLLSKNKKELRKKKIKKRKFLLIRELRTKENMRLN